MGPIPGFPFYCTFFPPFWSFPAARRLWGWQPGHTAGIGSCPHSLSHSIQVNRVMTYRDLDSDLMKYSAFQTLVSGQLLRRGAGSHRHMQGFVSSSQALQPLLCEALRLPGDSPFAGDILLGCESIPGPSLSQCSQGQSPLCPRLPPRHQ